MAQHIDIKYLEQKVFRKIEEGVHKYFQGYAGKTSLKYIWDKELSDLYKENDEERDEERYYDHNPEQGCRCEKCEILESLDQRINKKLR